MQQIIKLFKSIDEFVFSKLDQLQNSNPYQSFFATIESNLDEQSRLIVEKILAIVLVFLPLLIALVFLLLNLNVRGKRETQLEILKHMKEYTQNYSLYSALSSRMKSAHPISNKNDLKARITQSLNRKNINATAISIGEIQTQDLTSSLSQSSGALKFSGLSTQALSGLMEILVSELRIKIHKIHITNKLVESTLNGRIDFYHFGTERNK